MQELWTIQEVSQRLKVPVATLRYWRAEGRGPLAVRIGTRLLYRPDDVTAWVDAQFAAGAAS